MEDYNYGSNYGQHNYQDTNKWTNMVFILLHHKNPYVEVNYAGIDTVLSHFTQCLKHF